LQRRQSLQDRRPRGIAKRGLTREEAANFMKHAKDLPLEGQSAIVREVIAERAKGKI
jgi:hypothetical protein